MHLVLEIAFIHQVDTFVSAWLKKNILLLYTILVPIGVILLKFVTYSSSYAIENSGNTVYCISHLLMAQKFTCIIIRWSVSITVRVLQRKQGTVRVIKSA